VADTVTTGYWMTIIRFIKTNPEAVIPSRATEGSSGLDIHTLKDMVLGPMERIVVPTGLKIALAPGYEAQVRPRSGLAARKGITVLNAPGTIDSDYRGNLGVILINLSTEHQVIQRFDRIAQLVVAPVSLAVETEEVRTFDEQTHRGEGGFGSTGY